MQVRDEDGVGPRRRRGRHVAPKVGDPSAEDGIRDEHLPPSSSIPTVEWPSQVMRAPTPSRLRDRPALPPRPLAVPVPPFGSAPLLLALRLLLLPALLLHVGCSFLGVAVGVPDDLLAAVQPKIETTRIVAKRTFQAVMISCWAVE